MAEPEPRSIDGQPTPEPPPKPTDIARKIKHDASHRPLPDKVKAAASELYREVSGAYEAKQEREAARPPEAKRERPRRRASLARPTPRP
jgi:hypothetical protein